MAMELLPTINSEKEMTVADRPAVFVATSKRFYQEAEQVVARLREIGLTVFHPYFHLDPRDIDADPEKSQQ